MNTDVDGMLNELIEEYLLEASREKVFYESPYSVKRDFLKWIFQKFLEEKK